MRDMRVSAHDRILFDRAAEIAIDGEHHRVRVGCVLAKGRTMLSRSYNRISVAVEPFKAGHAERQVIDGMPAIKCTLYVARRQLNGALAPSWPCDECMEHIKACGCVSKIVYHDGAEIKKVRL